MTILPLLLIAFIIYIGGRDRRKYKRSKYRKESGNSYSKVKYNKGYYGEYLIFNKLDSIKGKHKILTNVYIEGYNGSITEIDLIFIHETGIYVIESKNYSGWIHGNENWKYWYETFKSGREEKFYNPIWQNNSHIKFLMRHLKLKSECFGSVIAFSENCTIMEMETYSENIEVITIDNLVKTINKIISDSLKIFSKDEVDEIYNELKQFTQVSKAVKKNHVKNVKAIIKKDNY